MSGRASATGAVPDGDDWAFEIKWDGYRTIAHVADGRVRLQSTAGHDVTGRWPEFSGLAGAVNARSAILDGELVVFDDDGRVGVILKRDGRILRSPVITGTAAHTIVGHDRLECHTCHSRTVVQCYGCHTTYDQSEYGWDYLAGRATKGAFSSCAPTSAPGRISVMASAMTSR